MTASFGRILPNSLLELFSPGRRLNVHPSLLPMYRGPAPIQHAILDGQSENGVCVIEMTEARKGIDSGEIWGREQLVCVFLFRGRYEIFTRGHASEYLTGFRSLPCEIYWLYKVASCWSAYCGT